MARGAWSAHAWTMALIANTNRDPDERPRPFAPKDFDRFARRIARRLTDEEELYELECFAVATGAKASIEGAAAFAPPKK